MRSVVGEYSLADTLVKFYQKNLMNEQWGIVYRVVSNIAS